MNTDTVCASKKGEMKKPLFRTLIVVRVIIITAILRIGHAIVVEIFPWNTCIIPPEMTSLKRDANREKNNSTHRSVGSWSDSLPLLTQTFFNDLKLNRGV